jgi:hypothetical protein
MYSQIEVIEANVRPAGVSDDDDDDDDNPYKLIISNR